MASPMVPMVKYIQTQTGSWGGGPGENIRKSHFKKSWELMANFRTLMSGSQFFWKCLLMMGFYSSTAAVPCCDLQSVFDLRNGDPKHTDMMSQKRLKNAMVKYTPQVLAGAERPYEYH